MNAHAGRRSPAVINGINVDDMQALIAAVQADPANGITRWTVKNTWQGRAVSHAEVESCRIGGAEVERHFAFDIDEPAVLGGADTNANPQECLVAAYNACLTAGYAVLCALNGIAIDKLEIETEGALDLRGMLGLDDSVAPGHERLETVVRIKGDATRAQFEQIHRMVRSNCPGLFNLAQAVPLNAALVIE